MTVFDGVLVDGGGWMRMEDYCNSQSRGNHLGVTSGLILADEELLGIECGWRVANVVIEQATTGWNPLLDEMYRRRWGTD